MDRAAEGSERLAATVRRQGVHDERLLSAIAETPRAAFVPLYGRYGYARDEHGEADAAGRA